MARTKGFNYLYLWLWKPLCYLHHIPRDPTGGDNRNRTCTPFLQEGRFSKPLRYLYSMSPFLINRGWLPFSIHTFRRILLVFTSAKAELSLTVRKPQRAILNAVVMLTMFCPSRRPLSRINLLACESSKDLVTHGCLTLESFIVYTIFLIM